MEAFMEQALNDENEEKQAVVFSPGYFNLTSVILDFLQNRELSNKNLYFYIKIQPEHQIELLHKTLHDLRPFFNVLSINQT